MTLDRLFTALAVALLSLPAAGRETISYRITDEPGADGEPGSWRVEVRVSGLDEERGAVGFAANGWGWPDDLPFLEVLESEPPLAAREDAASRLRLEPLGRNESKAHVVYRLRVLQRGSEEQQRHGLLPNRGDGFALGSAMNALLRPTQDGEPLDAPVEFELLAADPRGAIVTGWRGRSVGRQSAKPDTPWGNAYIVFGEPSHTATARARDRVVEAYQFGPGADATRRTADVAAALIPAIERYTGWPARKPSRIFLSNAMSGGMGTDYGVHLNVPPDAGPDHAHDAFFTTTIAHELFHEWLGIRLHESHGSLVWFREGFTEYFSLWLSAAVGTVPRESFAESLEEYDHFARGSTNLGQVAFADPSVNWRDGDGPNELMAYRGGPVLALALDVELRAAGHAGLLQLVRDFLSRDEHVFPPEDLRTWFVDYGLEDVWKRSVAGLDVPPAIDSLARAGFASDEVPVDVPYLGLETVEEKPVWHVLGVDPEGPAAKAGVQVGDVIDGFFPFNGSPVKLRELDTPYTFGLAIVTPGIDGTFLGIRRGDEKLKVFVDPELRPWGLRRGWRAGDGTDEFFTFDPR